MNLRQRITELVLAAGHQLFQPPGTYLPIHHCGLPDGWKVQLCTKRKVVDGAHCVLVYADRVAFAALRCGYNFSDWRIVTERRYETVEQMLAAVAELTAEEQAECWRAS